MLQYVFPYKTDRARTGELVYRPAAFVQLMAQNGSWHLFRPYVDSGADLTLLKRCDCEDMGYDLKTGIKAYRRYFKNLGENIRPPN